MSQLFVQIFKDTFAVINRLINRVAQVSHKDVIKAFTQLMQLVLLLDQNIILQTVVNTFDFTLKVAHTGKEFRTVLITIIRRVNNRIDGLASLIVLSNVPLNFIRNGIELLRNRFA